MTERLPPLSEPVALAKTARQSEGDLYESFLKGSTHRHRRQIQKWHHYFDVYERHLSRFRGKRCRLLEFGVRDGGSLLLWNEYLGPQTEIFGVDIDPRTARYDRMLPNIRVLIGDQAEQGVLDTIVGTHGPFDIVIDDGGHTARQQINTFNGIYGSVAEDGVYVCEDTHTSYWPKFRDAGPSLTMMEHAKTLIDEMHSVYRIGASERFGLPMEQRDGELKVSRFAASTYSIQFYDSIIVFEKRPRAEPFSEIL